MTRRNAVLLLTNGRFGLRIANMSTETQKPPIEEATDLRAVLDHAFKGRPLDAEVARRIEERAQTIRKRLALTNIAVDLIRESRDET
jgi:hypothetical protein